MVDSPCIDICTTDPESGLCVGCGRTQEEIVKWVAYSNKQKQQVLLNINKRNGIVNKPNNMLHKR
jgi:uncharacterized protein